MPQFRSNRLVATLPFAQAMTIKLLPVNNSAPPTITRTSPNENVSPITRRLTPYPTVSCIPAPTVVAKTAPREMKAPARTARTNVRTASTPALRTPASSAFSAISAGNNESRFKWVLLVIRRSGDIRLPEQQRVVILGAFPFTAANNASALESALCLRDDSPLIFHLRIRVELYQ